MKRFILFLMMIGTANIQMFAVPQLPADRKCVVAKPSILWKKTIRESEIQSFLNSGNWGQKHTVNKYWTVYSDRSHNITYNASSTSSGNYGELDFNEQVRIAKIENDFALVYTEKKKGVLYPLISEDAVCRGWIPMKNLLLWDSCPTDEKGIYNKALIVLNIDELRKGNTDLGKMYNNPATKDNPHRVVSDMEFYFVMKKSDNGLVLLSRECKMEGYTSSVLYGWVSPGSFVPMNSRVFLEPNWKPAVAEQLKGVRVYVYNKDGEMVTGIELGRENGITNNPRTKYRLEPQMMRYSLLGNKSDSQYHVAAFVRPDGFHPVPVPLGYDNTNVLTEAMDDKSVINLIVVIDGTKSMENYYQPIQKIIQQAYDYFGKENKTVKVGVVIYRDYTEGNFVTEHLTMRSPTDPKVSAFLENGGEYGFGKETNDHTLTEALYKGLEVALDAKTMGYSPKNNNLMIVIGDCGNDIKDKRSLSQEGIVKKCIENRMQVLAFQVRNENDQAFLLFRKQMGAIVRNTLKAQYGVFAKNARFSELKDGYGYRFESGLPKSQNFYMGEMRYAALGESMELSKLESLIKDSYIQFGEVIDAQIDVIRRAEEIIREIGENTTMSSIEMSFLEGVFTKKQIEEIKRNNSLMAFQGYVDKQMKELDIWQPVIHISSDEFAQLMEKLEPVMYAAKTGDRKPYIEAIKALVRSMLPGITQKEMDEMSVSEVMALVSGLTVKTQSMSNRTLAQIMDIKIVKDDEFDGLIADFKNKYNKLRKIRENKYDFSVVRNKTLWYWLPVEDLP